MNIGDGSLLPVSVLAEDFDPTGNAITDWIGGFVYLIWPRRMSAFDCSFTLIANKPTNFLENDFCYELDEPLNMEMVMRDGVVMNEEVERVEAIENQTNNLSQVDTPLSQIERKTLLTIIGAMLELLQKPRQSGSNQTTVIQSLLDSEHKHKTGIKERTLQEKFAAANQCLRSY